MPAWLLCEPVALWRNQQVPPAQQARRSQFNEIIRRDVVDLMDLARQELRMASGEMVYMSSRAGDREELCRPRPHGGVHDGYTRYHAIAAGADGAAARRRGSLPGLDGLPAAIRTGSAPGEFSSEEGGLGVDWLRRARRHQGAIADDIRESRERTIHGSHPSPMPTPRRRGPRQGALEGGAARDGRVGRLLEAWTDSTTSP